jgi:hypothetical protein
MLQILENILKKMLPAKIIFQRNFYFYFYFFDMSTQEGEEGFELVTSISLSMVLAD